jgi:hypothetical protein
MSAFLKQKLWQKPGLTNTPVVGVTIVKPSVTLRAFLSQLAFELGVSEDYLSLGLRTSLGTDPKQFARIDAPKRSVRPWEKLARANGA